MLAELPREIYGFIKKKKGEEPKPFTPPFLVLGSWF
jgi:hypothetical protein